MRLLADAQVPAQLPLAIRALSDMLGWQVRTVYEQGVDEEPNDAQLIHHAREELQATFLTLDRLKGTQSGLVYEELNDKGGSIICVSGGPEQGWVKALGKLLFHSAEIEEWLEQHEGAIFIEDSKAPRFIRRGSDTMHSRASKSTGVAEFDQYVAKKDAEKGMIRRRVVSRPLPPVEQEPLPIEGE